MSTDYAQILKETVCSDILLFKYWYDFQFNIEQYIPADQMQSLMCDYPDNVRTVMLKNPAVRAKFKAAILKACQLDVELDYDVSSPVLPYAILSPHTIKRLIVVLGALVCYSDIAKIIGKSQLDEIWGLIGRDVYIFVIKRSLLFWKKIPTLQEQNHGWKLGQRIQACGKKVFEYVIHGLPDSVIKRLNLRTAMNFNGGTDVAEQDFTKSLGLAKYAISNFFADDEGAQLCLK